MEVKACTHLTFSGKKCEAPALSGLDYCRHHVRYYDANDMPAANGEYVPAPPDAPDAALLTVHQATRAFLAGKIDDKTCRLLIYAAQVESQILHRKMSHDRMVKDSSDRNDAAVLRSMYLKPLRR